MSFHNIIIWELQVFNDIFIKHLIKKRHHEKLREFPRLPAQVATDGRIRALNSMENDIVRSQFL
jgi:hypothetical protein